MTAAFEPEKHALIPKILTDYSKGLFNSALFNILDITLISCRHVNLDKLDPIIVKNISYSCKKAPKKKV